MHAKSLWYILCPSFHGATLLSVLLNGHPDIASTGDTNPTRRFDGQCGCGRRVSQCEFWQNINKATSADERFGDLPTLLPLYPVIFQQRLANQIANLFLSGHVSRFADKQIQTLPAYRDFADSYTVFLEQVFKYSPHSCFVDGQKSLLKTLAASCLNFPVKGIIHLSRDPRGYAASCKKYNLGSVEQAAREWRNYHRRVLRIRSRYLANISYLQLRYEDLAADTTVQLEQLANSMKLPVKRFIKPVAMARPVHFIGNKSLKQFDGNIALREEWKEQLTSLEQERIMELCADTTQLFGYE